jgi:hypothetical protein
MSGLDGNAAAGLLEDVFGRDLTAAMGECGHCGNRAALAETMAYMRGPGLVLRCRICRSVLVVVTEVRSVRCVDLTGVDLTET